MAICPECEAYIEVDEFDCDVDDLLSCPECGAELQVTGIAPLELDHAPDEEEEDASDDDEEDDEEDDDEDIPW